MDGVKALASTRRLLPAQVDGTVSGTGPVLGMTIGNMVADLYERAEFLGLHLKADTLKVTMSFEPYIVEGNTSTYQIRAEIEGESR